jgi:hypothetical protein
MADKPESQLYQGFRDTLKAKAYEWLRQHLDERHKGKIIKLASFLGIDYKTNKLYLWQISSDFKTDVRNRQGLKPPNWHNWLGRIKTLEGLSREEAVKKDWVQTKAKNHYLLWKDPRGLGRLEWHVDGTVKVWVRKPVSDVKKLQLLANGFFNTYLVSDIKVFTEWAKTLRQTGEDCAVHVGFDVPYFKIDLFEESNGITIVGGDKTHRDCVEARLRVPEWSREYREKADFVIQGYKTLIEQLSKPLQDLSQPKPLTDQGRSMVV